MRIFVKSLVSNPATFIIRENATVGMLKESLGGNFNQYSLHHNGRELLEENSLEEYGIKNDDTLFCSFHLNGGGAAIQGIGVTKNNTDIIQEANSEVAQKFTGICDIQCVSVTTNVSLIIVDSNIEGGITINNECSLDATCAINSSMSATNEANLEFFGQQQGQNLAEVGTFTYTAIGVTANSVYNEQKMNLVTTQSVYQECDLGASASLSDINIYAQNSSITGGISIANSASNSGACTLEAALTADNVASGLVQTKQTGQTTKAGKKGDGKNKGALWTWIGAIAGVLILAYIIIAVVKSSKTPPPDPSAMEGIEVTDVSNAGNLANAGSPPPSQYLIEYPSSPIAPTVSSPTATSSPTASSPMVTP